MGALIRASAVSKVYQMGDQEVRALDGVSLEIAKGDYVAIMGASGSGKSTMMNLLGALDQPTAGLLECDGCNLGTLSANEAAKFRNEMIGFVFQQFNLLPRTSAVDNAALPLLYAGLPSGERRQRATACLEQVGLGKRLKNHPAQLSGGQQQRVAIARALVNEPQILLADEPTGALDSTTSAEIMAIFDQLNSQGMTVILVTHEDDVASHAQRQLVFRDGKIIEDRS